MKNPIFIIGDGDGIRRKIEFHLLNGDLNRLAAFSASLTESVSKLAQMAMQKMQAETVFAGGDDIFFIVDLSEYHEEIVRELMDVFTKMTGCSISFGVGLTVQEAFINLRLAKANNSGSLVSSV
jgi:hypothetical protein